MDCRPSARTRRISTQLIVSTIAALVTAFLTSCGGGSTTATTSSTTATKSSTTAIRSSTTAATSAQPRFSSTSTTSRITAAGKCKGGGKHPCYSYLRWGTGGQYQYQSSPVSQAQDPSFDISGLEPATTYHYQVCRSADARHSNYECVGPHDTTGSYGTFTTAPCDKVASATSGNDDTGDGTAAKPYRSVVKLDRSLAPGQTGCLRNPRGDDVYGSSSTLHRLTTDGTDSGRITITTYPGDRPAVIVGWLALYGAYTTITRVEIDGSNTFYQEHSAASGTGNCPNGVSQALDIEGHDDVLDHVDYFQSVEQLRSNGVGVGFRGSGYGDRTIIRYSKIHDTGQCDQYDHSIYVHNGADVRVYENWIWDNHGGQAVLMYPGPTNGNVYGNVIDHSDSGFAVGDDEGYAVSGNRWVHNIVMNSGTVVNNGARPPVSFAGAFINCYWRHADSTGNVVTNGDSFNNPGGIANPCANTSHISISGMTTDDPQLADPAHHDYAPTASSPVAGWGLWNGTS
jgi:hypothetical protein